MSQRSAASERAPLLTREEITHITQAEQQQPAAAVEPIDPRYATDTLANRWARWRFTFKDEIAEFLGCFILIIFGTGADCQVVLTGHGSFLSINFGWALGVALGVWISGGISGGHINPAVTIASYLFRGFPAHKVPGYIIAQVAGCFFGTLAIYLNYYRQIRLYDPHHTLLSSALFHASPTPSPHLSVGSLMWSEILATAILVGMIFSFSDRANLAPPHGTMPVALFLLVLGIGVALGSNTAYGMNPARDFGPRLALAMVGYGSTVFSHDGWYWIWNGIFTPIVGAIAGTVVYDSMVYTGVDSFFNRPSHRQISLPA